MEPTAVKSQTGHAPKTIDVTVSFPLAGKGPFKAEVKETSTVEELRVAAMAHFAVADDASTLFYLTHAGQRVDGNTSVGDVAGHARAVKFTLSKEIVQG